VKKLRASQASSMNLSKQSVMEHYNEQMTPSTRQEKRKSYEEKMAGKGKYNAKHVRLRAESATRSQKLTHRQNIIKK